MAQQSLKLPLARFPRHVLKTKQKERKKERYGFHGLFY